ncbi:unnamed protein product [Phytophthora fragariaefolia]|uniref:Unnamed protein product n=1 Tax=Phytophthora fragariaefolia TaxID=1490495 RepID=A0A9W6YNK4_9STRA|nr:unnamed protein product [Phytophthora fragariaefolia]
MVHARISYRIPIIRSTTPDRLQCDRDANHKVSEIDVEVDETDSCEYEGEEPVGKTSTVRVWKIAMSEWKFLMLGGLGAATYGAVYPVNGLLIGVSMKLYSETYKTKHEMLHDVRYYSLYLRILAVVCCGAITLMSYGYGVASNRLTARIRVLTYGAMLRQKVGWFDLPHNSSGSLVSRLASDSTVLHSMASENLSRAVVGVATAAVTLALSFIYSWQMTLVMTGIVPLLVGCNFMRIKNIRGQVNAKTSNNADAAAASLLSEAIDAIRTVASFGMENSLVAQYTSFLDASNEQDKRTGMSGGIAFGLSQGVLFLSLALIFYVGGYWVTKGTVNFYDLFTIIMIFRSPEDRPDRTGSFSVSMASQGSVDGTKAKQAAANVFKIIDRVPEIDATSTAGTVLPTIQGDINFRHLTFAYPSRPHARQEYGYRAAGAIL